MILRKLQTIKVENGKLASIKLPESRELSVLLGIMILFHKQNPFGFVSGNPLPLGGGRSLVNS